MNNEPLCACGKPLHYPDPITKKVMEKIIELQGAYTTVHCGNRSYKVSRHYIALHVIKAQELAALADQGIVERVVQP